MLIDILVILDRSGSMEARRADHEGGLRSFVREQQGLEGDVRFTLVQFDTASPCEVIYDRVPLDKVGAISLIPRGGTPLLDAVGKATAHLMAQQVALPADQTVVMIITDGQENSSTEWTKAQVKERVAMLEKQGYVFLFLGANVDAFHEAGSLGVPLGYAVNYTARPGGIAAVYAATAGNLTRSRVATAGLTGQRVNSGFARGMTYTDDQRAASIGTDTPTSTGETTDGDLSRSGSSAPHKKATR